MTNLSEMPLRVAAHIVDYLDLESVLAIRKCSKQLRDLADNRHFYIDSLKMELSPTRVVIQVSISMSTDIVIEYCHDPSGCLVKESKIEWDRDFEIMFRTALLEGESFVAIAAADLKIFLSHPETLVREFYVKEVEENRPLPDIKNLLKGFEHQVLGKEMHANAEYDAENVRCLLEFSKPGTLETIQITRAVQSDWSQIVELEQWKRAKKLLVSGCKLPISWILHFEDASIWGSSIDVNEFKRLVERASKIENDKSYRFYMQTIEGNNSQIQTYLAQFFNLFRNDNPNQYHIQIPNSEYHLLIDIWSDELIIRKFHSAHLLLNR